MFYEMTSSPKSVDSCSAGVTVVEDFLSSWCSLVVLFVPSTSAPSSLLCSETGLSSCESELLFFLLPSLVPSTLPSTTAAASKTVRVMANKTEFKHTNRVSCLSKLHRAFARTSWSKLLDSILLYTLL